MGEGKAGGGGQAGGGPPWSLGLAPGKVCLELAEPLL